MPAAAIIIATERSPWSRVPLALLQWRDDERLVEFHLRQLRDAGIRDVQLVLGYEADTVIPFIGGDNVEPMIVGAWETGAAAAWRTGASGVLRGTDTAVLSRIDQPRPASVFATLLEAHAQGKAAITVPTSHGRRGAPLIAGAEALAALRNVRDDDACGALLQRFAADVREVAFASDVVLLHIDGEMKLDAARRAMSGA